MTGSAAQRPSGPPGTRPASRARRPDERLRTAERTRRPYTRPPRSAARVRPARGGLSQNVVESAGAPELAADWVSGALTHVSPMSAKVRKPVKHGKQAGRR